MREAAAYFDGDTDCRKKGVNVIEGGSKVHFMTGPGIPISRRRRSSTTRKLDPKRPPAELRAGASSEGASRPPRGRTTRKPDQLRAGGSTAQMKTADGLRRRHLKTLPLRDQGPPTGTTGELRTSTNGGILQLILGTH